MDHPFSLGHRFFSGSVLAPRLRISKAASTEGSATAAPRRRAAGSDRSRTRPGPYYKVLGPYCTSVIRSCEGRLVTDSTGATKGEIARRLLTEKTI